MNFVKISMGGLRKIKMISLTFYGGAGEVGGNKILLGEGDCIRQKCIIPKSVQKNTKKWKTI